MHSVLCGENDTQQLSLRITSVSAISRLCCCGLLTSQRHPFLLQHSKTYQQERSCRSHLLSHPVSILMLGQPVPMMPVAWLGSQWSTNSLLTGIPLLPFNQMGTSDSVQAQDRPQLPQPSPVFSSSTGYKMKPWESFWEQQRTHPLRPCATYWTCHPWKQDIRWSKSRRISMRCRIPRIHSTMLSKKKRGVDWQEASHGWAKQNNQSSVWAVSQSSSK